MEGSRAQRQRAPCLKVRQTRNPDGGVAGTERNVDLICDLPSEKDMIRLI